MHILCNKAFLEHFFRGKKIFIIRQRVVEFFRQNVSLNFVDVDLNFVIYKTFLAREHLFQRSLTNFRYESQKPLLRQ